MDRVSTYRIPVPVDVLRMAADDASVPATLVGPLQVLVANAVRRGGDTPLSIYICSDDDVAQARDDFAAILMRAVSAHMASALLVDCDFMHVGLNGLIPQKDALGFLDFLLYGSSIGVITQEARGGLRVVGAGSFPVTKRMPFVESAFEDASRRLVAHARCAAFVGPLTDGAGGPHPLCALADVVAVVRTVDSVVLDVVEEKIAEAGSDVWSVRFGAAPAEAPRIEVESRDDAAAMPSIPESVAAPPPAKRPPARPRPPAPAESRYTSLAPRLAIIAFGVMVIAFVAWWFTQPHGTGGGADSPDTTASSVPVTGQPAGAPMVPVDSSRTIAADTTAVAMQTTAMDTARGAAKMVDRADTGGRTGGTQLISPNDIHVMAELDQSWRDWYMIHISSFQESIRAREEVAFLESREFPVFIVFLDLGPKGKWYRVYAGPFRTREEARDVKKNLDAIPQVRFTRIAKIPE
jgi:SPOR domain